MSEAAAPASAPATEIGNTATNTADVTPGVTQAKEAPVKESAAPTKPETFELKIDGKTVKMSRDEILQHASLGHASQKRFQEAAQLKKQAEAALGNIRDPKKMMTALMDPALGLTKEQVRASFEEWYTQEFIDPETLTPEQKKIREYEAQLKKYSDAEKEREDQKAKDHEESMTSQAREELQKQIIDILDTSGLPKTNFTIRRLAYWMQRNHANGFDAPKEVVVGQVRNEINSSLRDLVEASDGDVLIKILGDNVIQKLRKYDLEQLRKTRGQGSASSASPGTPANEEKRDRPLTSAEVNQRIRGLQKTGRY